jgi:hypothetical protein
MTDKDIDNIRFRASWCSNLLVEPKSKKDGEISETLKSELVILFRSIKYGRQKLIDSKYFQKGNSREVDSIRFFSETKKTNLFRYQGERRESEHFSGMIDAIDVGRIYDFKNSWNLFTLPSSATYKDDKDYFAQAQVYMYLWGVKNYTLTYCLMNATQQLIEKELHFIQYKDIDDEEKIRLSKETELLMIVDPKSFAEENPDYFFLNEMEDFVQIEDDYRIKEFHIEYDPAFMEKLTEKAIKAKNWMKENKQLI